MRHPSLRLKNNSVEKKQEQLMTYVQKRLVTPGDDELCWPGQSGETGSNILASIELGSCNSVCLKRQLVRWAWDLHIFTIPCGLELCPPNVEINDVVHGCRFSLSCWIHACHDIHGEYLVIICNWRSKCWDYLWLILKIWNQNTNEVSAATS